MHLPDVANRALHRTVGELDRLRVRLAWSWRGVAVFAAALVMMAGSFVVLVAITQDVVEGDGIEIHDNAILDVFTTHRSGSLVDVARLFTNLGSVKVLIPLALLSGVLLWLLGARLIVAAAPALSLAVAGGLVGATKALVGRSRPPAQLHLVNETDASFPSGHSTDSAALFLATGVVLAVVVLHRPIARACAVAAGLLISSMVGASRLVLGVHWPTDVMAGSALGIGAALAVTTVAVVTAGLQRREPEPEGSRWARLRWRVHALATSRRSTLSANVV